MNDAEALQKFARETIDFEVSWAPGRGYELRELRFLEGTRKVKTRIMGVDKELELRNMHWLRTAGPCASIAELYAAHEETGK